jgi:hypothetical protein
MLKLSKNDFNEIRIWFYRNARQLELAIWQHEFENGSKEAVLDALSFYQNEDGGFGNALEPDSWNPNSTPYQTAHAISMLKMIDFTDTKHPVVSGLLRYLDSGAYFSDDGWEWSIPSNNDYPRAPWWNFEKADSTEEYGLSAEIACYILSICEKDSSVYKRAISVAKNVITRVRESIACDDPDGGIPIGVCMLAETLQRLELLDELDAQFLPEAARNMMASHLVTDASKWSEYGMWPHLFIETPESIYYNDYKDTIQQELDFHIKTRPARSVWGISWTWFENLEKYSKEFAVSENWWKGYHAILKMRYLKSFDRLEA